MWKIKQYLFIYMIWNIIFAMHWVKNECGK